MLKMAVQEESIKEIIYSTSQLLDHSVQELKRICHSACLLENALHQFSFVMLWMTEGLSFVMLWMDITSIVR